MLRKTVPDPYSGDWNSSVAGYGKQTVYETKRNADAFETPTLLNGEARQLGITVPGHEDICKPELPACNLFAMELSASVICVGTARRDRTDAKTSHAVAFIADCKRRARVHGMPANTALQ